MNVVRQRTGHLVAAVLAGIGLGIAFLAAVYTLIWVIA